MANDVEAADLALPVLGDLEAAAERIAGKAVRTPLLESAALNELAGGRVLIKPETLQRTGSFKFRGAMNKVSRLGSAARSSGVVAYSSGNHAQGVAAAAQLAGIKATIVMPRDAPSIKIENTRGYGADVVLYDRESESREKAAEEIARSQGAALVRPYDDPDIIAGQGTCGLELVAQSAERDLQLDQLLICCGGGGLTAGCAIAIEGLSPATQIQTVEPAGYDDTARSLAAGERLANAPGARSFCDALLAAKPGALTFAINQRLVSAGLAVTDQEVAEAMIFAFRTLKLVVEPGGAVALAAVLAAKLDTRDLATAVVISGGNVDPAVFSEVIAQSS